MEESNWQELQDEELLKQYLKGHFPAFESLYARHKGGSFRFILRQVQDVNSAEDLMQELWTKVVSNARMFNHESKFSTWLYQLARNLLIDRYRHLEVVSNVIVPDSQINVENNGESDDGKTDSELLRQRQKSALKHCLEKLPKAQLEAFLLKEEGALTQTDIALITGVNLEATKSRLRTAYQNLRDCISLKLGGKQQ